MSGTDGTEIIIDKAIDSTQKATHHPIWLGGAAAMLSACIVHPIDQTKIRSQTQYPRLSMLTTARRTITTYNIRGLWTGLSGSLLRQASYGIVRFGVYGKLKEWDRGRRGGGGMGRLVGNGALAGLLAGIAGAPAELVMVRMCSDAVKPMGERLGYKNAIQGLWRIWQEEGIKRLTRGMGATITRSVILNSLQLSCYDIVKDKLLRTGYFRDAVPLHLITAAIGGTISVTACAPVDVMKSRIQSNTSNGATSMSIIKNSIRQEGASVLFRGWLPGWLRMMPSTTLTFMFYEQLKRVF